MTSKPQFNPKPERKLLSSTTAVEKQQSQPNAQADISPEQKILQTIRSLQKLEKYQIRDLVEQAKKLGEYLQEKNLKTNQIRKFLDAVNQLKVRLAIDEDEKTRLAKNEEEKEKFRFEKIESDIILLKPKLAYATVRQPAVKPLNEVMSAAIDKIEDAKDFNRLVQLTESIIAYHKAAGGQD